jgi:hypothetical protein
MTIHFQCKCGRRLSARDCEAGHHGKCPFCGCIMVVPRAAQGNNNQGRFANRNLHPTLVSDLPTPVAIDRRAIGSNRNNSGATVVSVRNSPPSATCTSAPEGGPQQTSTVRSSGVGQRSSTSQEIVPNNLEMPTLTAAHIPLGIANAEARRTRPSVVGHAVAHILRGIAEVEDTMSHIIEDVAINAFKTAGTVAQAIQGAICSHKILIARVVAVLVLLGILARPAFQANAPPSTIDLKEQHYQESIDGNTWVDRDAADKAIKQFERNFNSAITKSKSGVPIKPQTSKRPSRGSDKDGWILGEDGRRIRTGQSSTFDIPKQMEYFTEKEKERYEKQKTIEEAEREAARARDK